MAEKPKGKDKPKAPSPGDSFWGVIIVLVLVALALNRTEWGRKLLGTATSTPEYASSTYNGAPPPDKPTIIIGQ
ncbi:MAG TPA: hypothetical protein VJB98_00025 [Candidatus Paceibacterota bacterium]